MQHTFDAKEPVSLIFAVGHVIEQVTACGLTLALVDPLRERLTFYNAQ
jgi:hypothetical protein